MKERTRSKKKAKNTTGETKCAENYRNRKSEIILAFAHGERILPAKVENLEVLAMEEDRGLICSRTGALNWPCVRNAFAKLARARFTRSLSETEAP